MLTIANPTVTREHVWTAFRRTPDVRLRERYHRMLLLMDGKSRPEMAPWRYRDEETIRSWGRAFHEAGLPGLERTGSPGRPAWLTPGQRAPLKEAGRQCPRAVGDHASVWTTTLGRHCISTRFGLE